MAAAAAAAATTITKTESAKPTPAPALASAAAAAAAAMSNHDHEPAAAETGRRGGAASRLLAAARGSGSTGAGGPRRVPIDSTEAAAGMDVQARRMS